MTKKLLDSHEVAIILGETVPRIQTMAREGILPPGVVVRMGRHVRYNAEKLDEWINNGGQSLPGGWKKEVR